MTTEVQAVADGRAGRLRVAFKAQATAHFLPQVVAKLQARAPDIRIDMTSVSTLGEEIEALAGGTVDAAFVWLPVGDERLDAEVVLSEPRVAALPPNHLLAGRRSVSLAELSDEPVVGPHATAPRQVSRFWVADPRPDGAPALYGPEGRTPEECLQLVAGGRGPWLALASVAGYFSAPHLAWVPVTDAEPFELAVAWLRGRENNLLAAMITHCRDTAHTSSEESSSSRTAPESIT